MLITKTRYITVPVEKNRELHHVPSIAMYSLVEAPLAANIPFPASGTSVNGCHLSLASGNRAQRTYHDNRDGFLQSRFIHGPNLP
jgi:hypothetical protein